MRASSRRPQAALVAIAMLMVFLGIGAFVVQNWTSESGATTARADDPEAADAK